MSAQAGMPPFSNAIPQSTEIEAALFELRRIGLDVEPTSALAAAAFTNPPTAASFAPAKRPCWR